MHFLKSATASLLALATVQFISECAIGTEAMHWGSRYLGSGRESRSRWESLDPNCWWIFRISGHYLQPTDRNVGEHGRGGE